jgi:hemolysin III
MYKGEKLNSITHLTGTALAIAGSAVLITKAALYDGTREVVSVSIFGAMLIVLYLFSTLYHSINGRAKLVLQKFDHGSIYLLIAGTYTPFTLVALNKASPSWGWSLFGVEWGLAAFGIAQELLIGKRTRTISYLLYVVMGWIILLAAKPLLQALPSGGLSWLVAGGLAYTFGIIFYALDTRLKHSHGIWHLFVLAGSLCHYIAVVGYVL